MVSLRSIIWAFSSKHVQFQSSNKSLINQACSGPSWENIGPWSFLYGPRCARSVLPRPQADILPVRPSCLVNKIYVLSFSRHSNEIGSYIANEKNVGVRRVVQN